MTAVFISKKKDFLKINDGRKIKLKTLRCRDLESELSVVASDLEAIQNAMARIKEAIGILEIGGIFKGKVKSIQTYGAFVEITPNKDGLLHISEIDWNRIRKVEDVLKVGQEIDVKLLSIDDNGKLKLSRKVLLPKPNKS